MKDNFLKKISVIFLIFGILSPSLAFAQNDFVTTPYSNTQQRVGTTNQNANTAQDKPYDGAGSAVTGAVGTCAVGSILSNLVSSTVGGAISTITGAATDLLKDSLGGVVSIEQAVPTGDAKVRGNTALQTNKVTGGGNSGSILDNFLNGIGSISWDSVGFCVANEMIRYIGNSTIDWIKTGFKGKPVFVDNPEKFFGDIADQELSGLVREIVGETTGIDVCQPFRVQLAIETIGSQGSGGRGSGLNCSLDKIKNNYEGFVGGDFKAGGLPGWFELIEPQNNYWGARELARSEALARITKKQNTATIELNWSKGLKIFKKCTTSLDAYGNCKDRPDGKSGEVATTPGGALQDTLNSRLDSSQRRLEIATTFDGIVSALVNEMIKIAINKTFEEDASVENQVPMTAYCASSPSTPRVGTPVTWSASAYGGAGSYTFYWSGDASGGGATISGSYRTPGQKNASVAIVSGSQTLTRTCSVYVYPAPVTTPPANTAPVPTISSLTPTSGATTTSVTIAGSNFLGTAKVNFKNQNVNLSLTPTSLFPSTITFIVPSQVDSNTPITTGVYEITVQNGTSAKSNILNFTVSRQTGGGGLLIGPVITELEPNSGPIGTEVTIWSDVTVSTTGTITSGGFPSGQHDILIDGRWARTVNNSTPRTSIIFTIPSVTLGGCSAGTVCTGEANLLPGTHSISVRNANGTSNSMNFTVTN